MPQLPSHRNSLPPIPIRALPRLLSTPVFPLLTQHRVGLSCEAIPSPHDPGILLGDGVPLWVTGGGVKTSLLHRRASLVHCSHHERYIFPGLCVVLFIHRVSHVGTYLCPSSSGKNPIRPSKPTSKIPLHFIPLWAPHSMSLPLPQP